MGVHLRDFGIRRNRSGNARTVDQDIEPAKITDNPLDKRSYLRFFKYICPDKCRVGTARTKLAGNCFAFLRIDIGNDGPCAQTGKLANSRLAYSGTATRDNRHLSG